MRQFEQQGIEFAFPRQTLYLEGNGLTTGAASSWGRCFWSLERRPSQTLPINNNSARPTAAVGNKRLEVDSRKGPSRCWSSTEARSLALASRNWIWRHRSHSVLLMPVPFNLKPKRPMISTGVPQLLQLRVNTVLARNAETGLPPSTHPGVTQLNQKVGCLAGFH